MGQGQARLGDCSQIMACVHGCPACPHPAVGPAIQGSTDTLTNSMPSMRVGDHGVHAACCNTNTWEAQKGSTSVFINNKAAHRLNDPDKHCGGIGKIIAASVNVIVGG